MMKRKPLAAAFKRTSLPQDEEKSPEARVMSLESGKPPQVKASDQAGAELALEGDAATISPAVFTSHDTVNTADKEQTEPARAALPLISRGEVEVVPGTKGVMIPADKPVNMTFTVTAKERYLWNLELSRRGLTGVSVLREAMNRLLDGE